MRPTVSGGADWGRCGVRIAETGLLYVRSTEGTTTNQVCRNTGEDPAIDVDYSNNCPHGAAAMILRQPARRNGGRAQQAGRHSADQAALCCTWWRFDLNAGEIAWKVPFGEGSRVLRNHPLLRGRRAARPSRNVRQPPGLAGHEGRPGCSWAAATRICTRSTRRRERRISRVATPFRTSSNPMTYRSRSGRQFVVIATGAGRTPRWWRSQDPIREGFFDEHPIKTANRADRDGLLHRPARRPAHRPGRSIRVKRPTTRCASPATGRRGPAAWRPPWRR